MTTQAGNTLPDRQGLQAGPRRPVLLNPRSVLDVLRDRCGVAVPGPLLQRGEVAEHDGVGGHAVCSGVIPAVAGSGAIRWLARSSAAHTAERTDGSWKKYRTRRCGLVDASS